MGRRKGSVNKVDVDDLPRGVSFLRDGRARPWMVRHRALKPETFASAEGAVARKAELIELERRHGADALDYDRVVHAQVVEARRILPAGVSLAAAAEFWARHHPLGESPLVATAVEDFIAAKKRASGRSAEQQQARNVRDLSSLLRPFVLAFGDQAVADVGSGAVLRWLESLGHAPRTVANYRNGLQTFFNFAVRRGWCGVSPMVRVAAEDLPKVATSAKHPLTIAQADALLAVVAAERPEWVPHFALRLFLGFRSSEAGRFRWEWIQPELGRVYIPAHATKTGDAWSIDDVPPRFWQLLGENLKSDPLKLGNFKGAVPKPYVRAWEGSKAIKGKRRAQTGLKARILEAAGLKTWPDNATRDTFCTLHISAYRDPQRTALVLKHTNAQTLHRSYLGTLVPEAAAREFFEG